MLSQPFWGGPLSQFTLSLSHYRLPLIFQAFKKEICIGEVEVIRSEPSDVFWHNLQTTKAEVRINEWTACPWIWKWMGIVWFCCWWDLKKHWRMFRVDFCVALRHQISKLKKDVQLSCFGCQQLSDGARPSPWHRCDMTTFSVTRKSLGEVGVGSGYLRDCVLRTVDPGSSQILKSVNLLEFQGFTSWIVGLFSKW